MINKLEVDKWLIADKISLIKCNFYVWHLKHKAKSPKNTILTRNVHTNFLQNNKLSFYKIKNYSKIFNLKNFHNHIFKYTLMIK